ncbi:hypothetical protein ACFE04_010959 [Oxalis oulophora]
MMFDLVDPYSLEDRRFAASLIPLKFQSDRQVRVLRTFNISNREEPAIKPCTSRECTIKFKYTMKLYSVKLQNIAKNTIYNTTQKIFLAIFVSISLVAFPFCFEHSCLPLQRSIGFDCFKSVDIDQNQSISLGNLKSVEIDQNQSISLDNLKSVEIVNQSISFDSLKSVDIEKECSIFKGKWIPYPKGPYYTNLTCNLMIDQQNCAKFGRNDTDFMKWRWKPDECELPLFDALRFLEIVRNKSMAFVGDSAASPEDISRNYSSDVNNFRRWYYVDYNFTLATLWSPYLVKSSDVGSTGMMSLNLDEADEAWSTQIENFDYLIISAGQWFFRPLIYHENGQALKCYNCNIKNITSAPIFYGYKMAFRTTFQKILESKSYKGLTFLRTFSPAHFENGEWNSAGSCERTRPYTNKEMKLDGYIMEMYKTQIEEFRLAEEEGKIRGLKFNLINTTEIMLMRPDGHPNHNVWQLNRNSTSGADCVHWCLPGPIDVWNEFLLYMMKSEINI